MSERKKDNIREIERNGEREVQRNKEKEMMGNQKEEREGKRKKNPLHKIQILNQFKGAGWLDTELHAPHFYTSLLTAKQKHGIEARDTEKGRERWTEM